MIVPFGPRYASMSPSAKQFEKLLLGRQLAHPGNPGLSWTASNVAIKRDPADTIKPDEAKSRDRIDGIVALVMAAGGDMVQQESGGPIIWRIGWEGRRAKGGISRPWPERLRDTADLWSPKGRRSA